MSSDLGGLKKLCDLSGKESLRALLVSVFKGTAADRPVAQEHLEELSLLADTYGINVVQKILCPVRRYDASTYVTKGKLDELVAASKEWEANLIVFDDEIAPSQQMNLEKAFGLPVIDRTEVILGVFAQRAQTKEARLQVELAQVKYEAPRLKRMWTHLSRQQGSGGGGAGGGGYLKGEGEKQIELDRRILRKKIDLLQSEIEEVKSHRETQRLSRKRAEIPTFALIGYTNVGKSTLLNALTDADVFVEDKLFATLDTTTRKFTLPNNQEILITDTVGFIRKLPHLLVAAFKSTLEEAFHSDILLHLIDASHPMAEEQAKTTYEVLKELNVESVPIITVLNKIDACTNPDVLQKLTHIYPKSVRLSALNRTGFEELQELMIDELSKQRKTLLLRIPQSNYAIISEILRVGVVHSQDYEDNDVLLNVEVPGQLASRLEKYIR